MVKSVYNKFTRVGKSLNSRPFKSAAILVLAFGLGLEIFTPLVYAQESAYIDVDETYNSDTAKSDTLTDSVGVIDSANVAQNQANDFLVTLISAGCLECFENGKAVAANPDIHPSAKVSLLTLVESNNEKMLTNPPTQNVYAHLQKEWLPGQTTANTSVYAQDGYDLLLSTGIDVLWESVRSVAYVVFVVVLIVAGFMMMFRQKIGGQIAITIFNTIPQVIVGLILVTFSFDIVGIVLNLSATLTNVAAGILGLSSPADGVTVTGPFSIFSAFLTGEFLVGGSTGGVGLVALVTSISGALLANGAFAAVGVAAAPVLGGAIAIVGIIGLLIVLVVLGIVLVGSIKVFITLLKAYVGILIDTILAPIYLTASAFPGRAQMRGDWFRRIIKNALTFTLVFFFVNLASFIFSANINLGFPSSLSEGATNPVGSGILGMAFLLKACVSIYLIYVAAESPKFLDEFLPQTGGKNIAGALQAAAKGAFGKVPIVGGMVGG